MVSSEYAERGCLNKTRNLIFLWSNPTRAGRLNQLKMKPDNIVWELIRIFFVIGVIAVILGLIAAIVWVVNNVSIIIG